MNPGQVLAWTAFLVSLVSALAWLVAAGGRAEAARAVRNAFRVQWLLLLASAVFLWVILFGHDFRYQYVASYSWRSMPAHFVYAAFWGGQEGPFLLWALITATLGLVLMRLRSALTAAAMFFIDLPLVMLGLVTLADFSVHSFANLGLTGFLLSFLFVVMIAGYGLLVLRLRDIPGPAQALGNFSRESMLWLGQLVFLLMCVLVTVGMSAPLITRLFGPPANVQTSY